MDLAVQEGADGQYHRFGAEFQAHLGDGAHYAIVFDDQILNRLLEDHQVGLVLQRGADRLAIQYAIRLRASGADGRALLAFSIPNWMPA